MESTEDDINKKTPVKTGEQVDCTFLKRYPVRKNCIEKEDIMDLAQMIFFYMA